MKSVSVRELKAHWADVEKQLGEGDSFVVLNRGKTTARIIPATAGEVLVWDDHLATAIRPGSRKSGRNVIRDDRDARW